MKQGKIFIISGPAGVGKDTIIKGVMQKVPDLIMVKSYTTRPARESDEVGNRVFVSEKEFQQMIKQRQMIEWARVHNHLYGRKKNDIVRHIEKGKNVIMDVDVQGAAYFEKIMPEVVSIFIKYESPEFFENRLRQNRPEISKEELKNRQKSMKKEMTYEKYYDYSVINYEGHPEKAIERVLKIITNHTRI